MIPTRFSDSALGLQEKSTCGIGGITFWVFCEFQRSVVEHFNSPHEPKKTCVKQTGFCCTFPTIYKFSSWNKRSTCCPNYFPSFPKKLEAKQSCQSCPLAARNPLKSCAKFWPHRINKKIWIWQVTAPVVDAFLLKQKCSHRKSSNLDLEKHQKM